MTELPPRARRIQDELKVQLTPGGTTSACAENTHQNLTHYSESRNYLRVRGEYESIISAMQAGGNYLRVRGEYHITLDRVDTTQELPPRARRIL